MTTAADFGAGEGGGGEASAGEAGTGADAGGAGIDPGGIGARTPFGSKTSPRVTGGAVISVDGDAENSERVASDCAQDACGTEKHRMTASAGQNRPTPGAGA